MSRLIEKSARVSAAIGLIGLPGSVVGYSVDAIMRSWFNAPIYGLSDFVEILTPVIVASCFPMAMANRQNITIRYLGRSLPARPGQLIELFGQLVALLVLAGIVWELARYTYGLFEYGQFTWLMQIPIWPSWIIATALLLLCLPIQLSIVTETWENLHPVSL